MTSRISNLGFETDSGVSLNTAPIDQFLKDKKLIGSVDMFTNPEIRNYRIEVNFGKKAAQEYQQAKSILSSIPSGKEAWISYNSKKLKFEVWLD